MLRRQHGNNATQASEGMLIDLTKVTGSIRSYASIQLVQQGVCPNGMVADAQWTLGYWYFARGNNAKARQAFLDSLKQKFRIRSLLYLIFSGLPASLIGTLRSIKQKFAKP